MSDLAAELRKVIEFDNPHVQGSDFNDLVINQSVCHTHRDDPAWMYSIKDAAFGAEYENKRLRPVLLAMVECVEALEGCHGCWESSQDTHPVDQALARLREIVGTK